MTQKELIKSVAASVNKEYKAAGKSTLTEGNVGDVITAFTTVTKNAVAKGDKVQIAGFGSFEASMRAARDGRNPITGETIHIDAKKAPKFKAAKAFKDILN